MKTIKHLLILLFLLGSVSLHSQDISINLSIRWSEGPYILNTDSIVKHPELVVSYTNTSKENLYFRKFMYYRNGLPDFLFVCLTNWVSDDPEMYSDPDWLKKNTNYRKVINRAINKYKNDKFYVEIKLVEPYYCADWEVVKEEEYDKARVTDWINEKLYILNDYLSDSVYHNVDERKEHDFYFSLSDITESSIMNDTINHFMFLKASETKEDVFNIACFDIVKGTYTFVLEGKRFKDSIFTGWCNDEHISLPIKVGEYKLYSGKFTSNSVTVKFE